MSMVIVKLNYFVVICIDEGPALPVVMSGACPPDLESINHVSTEGIPADAEQGLASARLHVRH